jgi:hypothetical protein
MLAWVEKPLCGKYACDAEDAGECSMNGRQWGIDIACSLIYISIFLKNKSAE